MEWLRHWVEHLSPIGRLLFSLGLAFGWILGWGIRRLWRAAGQALEAQDQADQRLHEAFTDRQRWKTREPPLGLATEEEQVFLQAQTALQQAYQAPTLALFKLHHQEYGTRRARLPPALVLRLLEQEGQLLLAVKLPPSENGPDAA